ncbi:MAG: HAD family phosphatase [Oscillospiraceae bacterium]|nr:HAD family phosphatase [Oscillospiraceae bacterium]
MENLKFSGYLLVSDMDATLLNGNSEVSERNQNAIKYFTDNGGKFTVASGRMVDAVRAYLPYIRINSPAILHNGAKVYDFDKECVLFERFIEEDRKNALKKVYENIPGAGLEVYSDEKIYVYRSCSETARLYDKKYDVTYSMPEHIWKEPWIKALVIAEREELDGYEKLYREYDGGNAVRSGDKYLDITANGVSKGLGVKKTADILGIRKENIIVVGDNMNDISMYDEAGISFAVENAEDEVKKAALYSAPHYDNDVIEYIVDFIEKKIIAKSGDF